LFAGRKAQAKPRALPRLNPLSSPSPEEEEEQCRKHPEGMECNRETPSVSHRRWSRPEDTCYLILSSRRCVSQIYSSKLEANATAEAIKAITEQMTDEYARYLWLRQWEGVLPSTLLGIIIDTP